MISGGISLAPSERSSVGLAALAFTIFRGPHPIRQAVGTSKSLQSLLILDAEIGSMSDLSAGV